MKRRLFCRALCGALATLLFAPLFPAASSAAESGDIRLPFRDLSAAQITAEMGLGWNLGNTMDGHSGFMPSETAWQSEPTTQALIDAVHGAGFNTVRIPVTWGLKIDDANDYAIDPAWMNRVREIADYCLNQGMYVIINIHHDGAEQTGWLRVAAEGEELARVKAKFGRVWEQIAEAFSGYDEHVMFESMNEVKSADDTQAGIKRDFAVIGELNQIFVDAVRGTGGNNTRRWLIVPGRYTNIINTTNEAFGFALPDDPWNEENRLMVSVHDYDYSFGLLSTMAITSWSEESAGKMAKNFQKLADMFTSKGVPVVLGEYGALNKGNTEARAYYYEVMARLSRLSGVVCCAWDQGWYDPSRTPDYSFSLFDRKTCGIIYPEIIAAILRGHFGADQGGVASIRRGTRENPVEIAPVSSIVLSASALNLAVGSSARVTAEALPEDANEAVLYSSSDPSVATVYDGLVRAIGIGKCVVTATTLSGKAKATLEVSVYPDTALAAPLGALETDAETYALAVGTARQVAVSLPAGTDDAVSFVSSDPAVATISKLGVLTGKAVGAAYIAVTSRSGLAKTVRVEVGEAVSGENALDVAIYAYYNDKVHGFYNNCRGESTWIAGNGTYSLRFDCARDLSEEAVKAGVSSLANVGAIYLADTAGQNGVLASCDILYEEILLDGIPLTLTQSAPRSALKAGGRFDTNDPVNAWDGSAVAEAMAQDYAVAFEGNPAPQSIAVRFTISNFALAGDAREETAQAVPAEISLSGSAVTLGAEALAYEAALSPADTTEAACFISGAPGVAWVSPAALWPDRNGRLEALLIPIGPGEATVTVRTPSGAAAEFTVRVDMARPALDGERDVYAAPCAYAASTPALTPADTPARSPAPTAAATDAAEAGAQGGALPPALFALLGAAGGGAVLAGGLLIYRAVSRKRKT